MNPHVIKYIVGAVLALLLLNGTVYTIKQTERGVLLRFGEVVEANLQPGLHFKLPLVHEVRRFDGRTQVADAEGTEYLTRENKFLIVDAYVMWRIDDVRKFYTATGGDPRKAELLLLTRVRDGLKNKVTELTVHEFVSGGREPVPVDAAVPAAVAVTKASGAKREDLREQLMADITAAANAIAGQEFGIKVVDVRVKRVDFPTSVTESIYNRMRTEREREARGHRSEGTEQSERIKADADRQKQVLMAEAYREAERLRGDGDAQAAAIAARAFGKDPEFYRFYRSLAAYRNTFTGKQDVLVLKPDSEFLRYLRSSGK